MIHLEDAGSDARFMQRESINRFQLREVLCVPMAGRHEEPLGVIFLDAVGDVASKTRVFQRDDLEFAVALGQLAAVAIEDTRYRDALLKSERLAAMGQTTAAISHHIKNILQGLVFGSDMVRFALAEDDRGMLSKGWALVERNQAKIHDLVLDLLQFSKPREPEKCAADLNSIVSEIVELYQAKAVDAGVALVFTRCDIMPVLELDPEGVHKALMNLVGNAIDAVEDTPHPRVEVRFDLHEDEVCIVVQDNGPGVPVEAQRDIFKPFISSKGARGTGLGLPIALKIAEEHGGSLTLNSQPGAGATFTFRLPRHPPDKTKS
jgi:signal transduction histidine kinase